METANDLILPRFAPAMDLMPIAREAHDCHFCGIGLAAHLQSSTTHLPAGQASALDAATVVGGRDVGTIGVFETTLDGQRFHFTPAGDGFRDTLTGTTWDVLGHATAGPLAGTSLVPVRHDDTFWFAWAAFQPHTTIVR